MSQQINLFNPAFRRQKKAFAAAAMLPALGAVAVGIVLMSAFASWQNRTLEGAHAESDRRVTAQREQIARFASEFSAKGSSASLAEELARAEDRLRMRRALLADVKTGAGGNAGGYSTYLAALARRTMSGLWLTGIELGGKSNDLVLKGRALDGELVPAYIRQLNQEEPFAGRSVSELRMAAKESGPQPAQQPQGPRRFVEFLMSIPL
jgi:hypothetical protein